MGELNCSKWRVKKEKTPNSRLREPSKFGENFRDIIHAVKSELKIKHSFYLIKLDKFPERKRGLNLPKEKSEDFHLLNVMKNDVIHYPSKWGVNWDDIFHLLIHPHLPNSVTYRYPPLHYIPSKVMGFVKSHHSI